MKDGEFIVFIPAHVIRHCAWATSVYMLIVHNWRNILQKINQKLTEKITVNEILT